LSETPAWSDHDEARLYEIRLKGHLNKRWADRFEGLTITLEKDGDTVLTGPVRDQAALHGVLRRVRDLGLPLISINPLESDRVEVTAIGSNQSMQKEHEK
jgi:hypothetical protein